MHSPDTRSAVGWLMRKEWRALVSSRAWWVLVALTGPLVGVTFTNAVRTYTEISAGAGAGCGAVCDPLIGIWGPTFAAFEIAAVFLVPFVAIKLVSGDRQSGALKLEIQRPLPHVVRLVVKIGVLLIGCVIAGMAALVAIALWAAYGGTVYWPEVLVAIGGHVLNAALTIAIAMFAAAITEHPSTAAIVTLAITVGTWILEFAAAINGGIWASLARFTPSAMVGTFQHGLVPVNTTVSCVVLIAGILLGASIWLRLGSPVRRRVTSSAAIVALTLAVASVSSLLPWSWDASEGRLNSFPEAAQEALDGIRQPINIEAHFAPEDPRRTDLERHAFAKLRRASSRVAVTYVSRTSTGLFEQSDPAYGEIRYEVGGRSVAGRATTDEAVLEAIFEAAGVSANDENEVVYMGHPLAVRATGAAVVFFGIWPAMAAFGAWRATTDRPASAP